MFRFKEFTLHDRQSALKVTTDAAVLGAWADVSDAHTILDAGCGCGILALMAAQRAPEACVLAVDIHPGSVADASLNAAESPFASRVKVETADILSVRGKFDVIISNPPFFTETLHSPDLARATARHAGRFSHLTLPSIAAEMLSPVGRLVFIAPTTTDSAVAEAISLAKLTPRRILHFRQSERRPWVRTIWETGVEPLQQPAQHYLTISDSSGYTKEYRALLAPFMLNF